MIRIAATAACPAICSTLPEDVSALTLVSSASFARNRVGLKKTQNVSDHNDGGLHRTADNCALWSTRTAHPARRFGLISRFSNIFLMVL